MPFNTDHKKALIITFVFHALVLCLLVFLALRTPLPLPQEEGVEVNLGYAEMGRGQQQSSKPAAVSSPPAPRRTKVAKLPNKPIEKVQTQEAEEVPAMPTPKKESELKPQPLPKENKQEVKEQKTVEEQPVTPKDDKAPPKPKEKPKPTVNPALLYKGKATDAQGSSAEGNTTADGDHGKPQGTSAAQNYEGVGGKGNNGIRYALGNRKAKTLPKPTYNSKDQGVVVVSIWVDKTGIVRRAAKLQKGTTVTDQALIRMAEQAAMQAVFTPDNSATAELQKGTITYVFRKLN